MFCQRFITCYLFYIYFILWKWCYRKSKFQRFSYLNSKWVVKQWKQVATPTTHLAQEQLMIMQCTSGSRSFAKETSLEDEQRSGWASEVTPTESVIQTDPLTTSGEDAEQLDINHSTVVQHLKQSGKLKKLGEWVSHELTEHQRNHCFEVPSSLILRSNEPSLHRTVDMQQKMDFMWQLVTTSSMAGQRRSYKALPEAKLALKKR